MTDTAHNGGVRMIRHTTGRLRGDNELAVARTLRGTADDVWQSFTDPTRLSRWYGTYTGDCADGRVTVVMTAEEGHEGTPFHIVRCERPHVLEARAEEAGIEWRLTLEVTEHDGISTLTLVQAFDRPDEVGSVGPGWEYYLDRLVAAETGNDVEAISWDEYYPVQQAYYTQLATQMRF